MKRRSSQDILIENIDHLIKQNGITQAKLAGDLHFDAMRLSNWKTTNRKRQQPDLETVDRIAEYFGVTTSALFAENMTGDEMISISTYADFLRHVASLMVSGFVKGIDVTEKAFYHEDRSTESLELTFHMLSFSPEYEHLRKSIRVLSKLFSMVSENEIDLESFRRFANSEVQAMRSYEHAEDADDLDSLDD